MSEECESYEEEILQLSRNGLHEELSSLINKHPLININCQGMIRNVFMTYNMSY